MTKKQKISLGILTFVVVVLPLSLFLVKTKTNLLPKATFPVTPPVSSPTPTPTITPWPSPSTSPYPSTSPGLPISLTGDTLPEDSRIIWQQLTINNTLLEHNQGTFSLQKNYTLPSSEVLPIEDGYGQFYIIHPVIGKKLETLVRELDINTNGSYIKTVLYGPDKKKIVEAGTRINFTTENTGPYYLVAHTFDHKTGQVEVTVSDEFRKNIFPYIKRIDKDMELLWDNYNSAGGQIGRKAADFFLQVPWLKTINDDIYIVYEHQTDQNTLQIETPRVTISQTCPSNGQVTNIPVSVESVGHFELNPLRTMQVKVYPQISAQYPAGSYFPPGYNYTINLEYPNPNVGWTTRFSTTSQSGLMADLNDDGAVDISDYSLLVSEFMQSNNFLVSDLNCDGLVDISDYSLLIRNISL